MLSAKRTVCSGDTVILYFSFNSVSSLVVVPGARFQCREGIFDHDQIIGAPYGTPISGRAPRKTDPAPSVTVLRPTPELWTQCVTHRTQIIYLTDIAVVVQLLRLRPGAFVVEAGTGSGSLTHSLARAVAPTGMVHTFDFHRRRASEARKEFVANGLGDVVTSGWRDVCSVPPEGEDVPGLLNDDIVACEERGDAEAAPKAGLGLSADSVDAVFLDVPAPWSGVPNVLKVLRHGGVFCSFSPCIEQTQKLCDAVRASKGFCDLRTVETLSSEYQPVRNWKRGRDADAAGQGQSQRLTFKPSVQGRGHTAFLTFARRYCPAETDAPATE